MKKSSLFILKSFFGPFVLTFFIAVFVLMMQFVWKYIEDLVGKGLDLSIIFELLFYTSASMVPMALPLAILLSSLMTFGNLGENYELVAFRSSGISLQRIMRPMAIFVLILSYVAFLFSNYILPVANLKMRSLLYDIIQQKPTVNIMPGIFYNEIEGYTIRVNEKSKLEDEDILKDVMIYDHSDKKGNQKVIVAESGVMKNSPDNRYLEITLFNGHAYEDDTERGSNRTLYRHYKNNFKAKKILIDMSQFELNRTDEDLFKSHHEMLNMKQLDEAVDTLQAVQKQRNDLFVEGMISNYDCFRTDSIDTVQTAVLPEDYNPWKSLDKATDPEKNVIFSQASNNSRALKTRSNTVFLEEDMRSQHMVKHVVEWHKKLTLSYACIVLFLIGAPLGSIIRKGGLGMPVVVSIVFFLLFHIFNITGEKLSKESVLPPHLGMWIASAVLTPIGMFITYKATTDSTLFDVTSYLDKFKKIFRKRKG